MTLDPNQRMQLADALEHSGQRPTRQREHVFAAILSKQDHPTADEIFVRARAAMPSISLATVYNCLEVLVESGLIRQVNFERDSTRYCPNLREHAHFHCQETGKIHDIELPATILRQLHNLLPDGFEAAHIELSFTGRAPASLRNAPKTQHALQTS